MTEIEVQSIISTTLTGFHIANSRVVHLRFTQYQPKPFSPNPEFVSAQIWLVMPKCIVFNITKRERLLTNATFESSPYGVISRWSFGDEKLLSVECKSISHIFLPVITD